MAVPEGFTVTLGAAEPDVRQPIALAFDDRGRIWIAECHSYPDWGPEGRDRILVLEDADGDGRLERRKVFREGLANLSGIEVGFGGVWACATPNLLFIPDRDGDDVPDGEPVVRLDGWDLNAKHNVFNGLTWGPDGWLYGLNGILSNSRVGKPGTPDGLRVPINCGVWRYHPVRETFEAVAWGTTNPWGLDFDDRGEMFISNCVIPHLFHAIPGARFQRMFGEDFHPHHYGLMGSCADHIHWAGGDWQDSRGAAGKHGEAGGGHAHAGAMIYLGDNWPERYRGSVFLVNIHGRRVNHDLLERKDSGYIARHEKDFLLAGDPWFRGIELAYGPDGAVWLIDWSDAGECHESDAHGAHRASGRIYRIAFGTPRAERVDLQSASDADLVRLQLHPSDWHARHARRILQERAAVGRDMSRVHAELRAIFEAEPGETRKLRALWALHATGGAGAERLVSLLEHPGEDVRGWSVRLLAEGKDPPADAVPRLEALARGDPSPRVRLRLASALQRLPAAARWGIAGGLLARAEDAGDPNLPFMLWYGVEPLVALDPIRAVGLIPRAAMPALRERIARRAAGLEPGGPSREALVVLLGDARDPGVALDVLGGMLEGLRGRKGIEAPAGWPAAYGALLRSGDAVVRERAHLLALSFGDARAEESLARLAADPSAAPDVRVRALRALAERRAPALAARLRALLADPSVRAAALRALAAYDDAEAARDVVNGYGSLAAAERADAIHSLASRASTARLLLDAVEAGAVPRKDLTAFTVRQMKALRDPEIDRRIESAWGSARPASREKRRLIAKYKSLLGPERLAAADLAAGKALFGRLCAPCHRLFGEGGDVGPDLTGSNRDNLDYVLENLLDPSATVGRDDKLSTLILADGRVLSGIVRRRVEKTLTIRTVNEEVVVPADEVASETASELSLMPEGTLESLTDDEARDLIGYVRSGVPR
jgi:putative membrane-bound dehydrogenase-like protein